MRYRFVTIWFLVLLLFSSLLVWRLIFIKGQTETVAIAGEGLAPPQKHLRPGFMGGVVFPQWGKQAYSSHDKYWSIGLQEIAQQTSAHWLSLPLTFHQKNYFATEVETQNDIPAPQVIASAILQAHQQGYQVFIYPLLTVDSGDHWAGQINFSDQADANTWFNSYWQALRPYIMAASEAQADQISIGNEFELLEGHFDDLWLNLINHVHSIYAGHVVYSINWSSLKYSIPQWLRYSGLHAIGVSTYFPLLDTPHRVDSASLLNLWQQRVGSQIDAFARTLAKPVFISEIGYRNTSDAGYLPYSSDPGTHAPRDDAEQARLYAAALQNVSHDRLINGIFIWAWSIAPYTPSNKPAAQVLKKWFLIL